MTSHYSSEHDLNTTDSVTSTPRSDNHSHPSHDIHPPIRFMCSFGGKILPRPHDNQLRYVGGDTRIAAVHRSATFSSLISKLSKLSGTSNITVKYQLPNEELDSLISVTTDEDVENMMEEYDRLTQNQTPRATRLRLFLFPKDDPDSRASSISSLIGGSANRDHWFLDALNGSGSVAGLERGRSEASSIVSEVPDYLFGLDNSEDSTTQLPRDTKLKSQQLVSHDSVSVSDPGSPAPVVSLSQFPSMPNLPPVKIRPESPSIVESKEINQTDRGGYADNMEQQILQPAAYTGNPNPMVHYIPGSHYPGQAVHQVPFYYVPGQVPPGNVAVQPVQLRTPYIQQYPTATGQIQVGYHHAIPGMGQVYNGGMRPVAKIDSYDGPVWTVSDGIIDQQMYYGVRNESVVPAYPGMVVPGTVEEIQASVSDINMGRVSQ